MKTPAWWCAVILFAIAQYVTLILMFLYCLDNYYDKPCPLDSIGYVLVSPAYFFFPLFGDSPLPILLFLLALNSLLWGCVLAEPFRWWFGWPAWRFSLRTLPITMTAVSVLLGVSVALKQSEPKPFQPVVEPLND
jgi:hypothetical protein